MIYQLFCVGMGSALGGIFRYLVSISLKSGTSFPWATLTVNVLGSLLIGILSGFLASSSSFSAHTTQLIRCFAVVGICGGFTTFSTFSNEMFRLMEGSQWGCAVIYASVSLVAGLLSVCGGYMISR